MRLFRHLAALLLAAVPAMPAAAQTTGFPFVNDLTVNGMFSGSTSCNLINIVGQPSTFQITAAPNSFVMLVFDFCMGCQAGAIPFPAATCPFLMTQSIDLGALSAGCTFFTLPGVTNAAGVFSLTFPASTAPPFRFGVQGFVRPSNCPSFLLTQAYDVWV